MPQNLLSVDDIYKNYGEALKHYSKVSSTVAGENVIKY